jgi:hypothetical protein
MRENPFAQQHVLASLANPANFASLVRANPSLTREIAAATAILLTEMMVRFGTLETL